MRRIVRAFLVWVMVIAMPVQGMAASAMLVCGPSHERMMRGLVPEASAAASRDAHDHAHGGFAPEHGVHRHTDSSGPDASQALQSADADGPPGLVPHHGKFSCSACAACCSVLALPAQFTLPEAPGLVHPAHMAPVAPIASHQPDGLDRPPRTVLG
jgi:hypothetical protein